MIKASIGKKEDKFWLSMYGHADGGEYGHDLICAAVTTLAYTMAQAVINMDERGELVESPCIRISKGNAQICFRHRNQEHGRITMDVLRAGLGCLAHNYPQNIALYFVGDCESSEHKTEEPLA
nr:MAG TPA: cysteine protease [Caudoviricetes sp.]